MQIAAKVRLFLDFGGLGGGVVARWGVGWLAGLGGAGCDEAAGLRMLGGRPVGRCGGFGVCSININYAY